MVSGVNVGSPSKQQGHCCRLPIQTTQSQRRPSFLTYMYIIYTCENTPLGDERKKKRDFQAHHTHTHHIHRKKQIHWITLLTTLVGKKVTFTVTFTLSTASVLAPAASKSETASSFPAAEANINAVHCCCRHRKEKEKRKRKKKMKKKEEDTLK